jgi:hypothetical protein
MAEEMGADDTGGGDPDVGALDGVGVALAGARDPAPDGWGVSANRYPGPSSRAYLEDLSAAAARVAE